MARIALEHVDKTYPNGYVAASDLSLEAADGELLVLVGPSGSGKSTVLRLMAGLERVSDGVIRIGERITLDHVQSLGVGRAVQIDHGKRPVGPGF